MLRGGITIMNEKMIIDSLNNKRNFTRLYVLFVIISLVNIITIASPLTLVVTLPQYFVVIMTLIKGDVRRSILFHFSFVMLSLSSQGTLGMFDTEAFSLFNYGTIKLVGPIRACYVMNIIYCIVLMGSSYKINKTLLLYRFYNVILYLCGSAILIGIFGLLINSYYSFDSFIDNSIYAFVLVTSLYIILKVANIEFIQTAYHLLLAGIMAGIAASFLCYVSGSVVSHYSVYDIAYTSDVLMLALALVIGIPYIRQKFLLWLSLALYGILLGSSLGGKGVFGVAFSVLSLTYLIFFDKRTIKKLNGAEKVLRPAVVLIIIGATIYTIGHISTSDSMASYKIGAALSMISGDLESMGRSPYIRVASLINIINDGTNNPLALLFGHGYGGYFQDNLGLFFGINLSDAWKDNVIATGRFTSGHDAMVTIPLYNGLLGVFLSLRISLLYIKRMGYNFLNSTIFFWFILMFYFNTIYAMIGIFGLIAAEYNVNGDKTLLLMNKDHIRD